MRGNERQGDRLQFRLVRYLLHGHYLQKHVGDLYTVIALVTTDGCVGRMLLYIHRSVHGVGWGGLGVPEPSLLGGGLPVHRKQDT